ncbi:hypothetical protein [Chryseobacterium jejuense]|uniref:hypothetical protein n=1 Tax=Chryseobacterium jejuense TaxID=445960 RepID=UPI001AE96D3A|nr:hypothetical protein [Chryseobacterium jejuense]MBP2616437.1 hypothetical protein [Chryseobacterium jejuense]
MSLEKKFYNQYFQEITEKQASQINDFYIKYLLDGKLKKIEDITSKYFIGTYYLDDTENLQSKIQEFCVEAGQRWIFHTKEFSSFGYSLWNWVDIDNTGAIIFKGKRVLDVKNREIFNCSIDLSSNQMRRATKRYFKGDDTEPILLFEYNEQNNLSYILDRKDSWGLGGGWPMDKEELIIVDTNVGLFPWDQHPYFHSALPFLPTSNSI